MLVNAHLSWRRRRSSSDRADGQVRVERADRADISAETVERDAVWRLIAGLAPKQRATIVLRFYEDLDDLASAEILSCSPVTVRTRAMRAIAVNDTIQGPGDEAFFRSLVGAFTPAPDDDPVSWPRQPV